MLLLSPAHANENTRAIGAVIAPHELIAAYSCTNYAESQFLPEVSAWGKKLINNSKDKTTALKQVLLEYDAAIDRMCQEISAIFQNHQSEVLDNYALHLPGNKSDIALFLAKPNGRRWAAESSAFLTTTAPLIQYYALTRSVAPEILSSALPDHVAEKEARSTSVGMYAKFERQILIQLLADEGFARVAPARFDLASLKSTEVRLRKEAEKLRYTSPLFNFNDNASDLIRMHFNGFDVMRRMGLADVYTKNHQQLREWMDGFKLNY